jgi:hypothetical protein
VALSQEEPLLRFLTAASALALMASPVSAAHFSFTSDDGSFNPFMFDIVTSPLPDSADATRFLVSNVSTTEQGQYGPLVYPADYFFYSGSSGGGFENGFVAYYSTQMFVGSTSAPTFYNGVFNLADFGGGPTVGTLKITDGATAAAVPELGTWAMMIGGLGMIGAVMRRRQRNLATTIRYA